MHASRREGYEKRRARMMSVWFGKSNMLKAAMTVTLTEDEAKKAAPSRKKSRMISAGVAPGRGDRRQHAEQEADARRDDGRRRTRMRFAGEAACSLLHIME
jgi:hypothetical protein